MTEFKVMPANRLDLPAIIELLHSGGLPIQGVEDQFPQAYTIVRIGDNIIAVAGLERYGSFGLLRSVAVHPGSRDRGLGRLLVEDRLGFADHQELLAVYLLTTTAPDFFREFEFIEIRRTEVPPAIASSPEFASICPASATCLVRTRFNSEPLGKPRRSA